jgi:hypothetical protein
VPWEIRKTDQCPASRPWGVLNQANGNVEGCHPTKAKARAQQKALYASERRRGRATVSGITLTSGLRARYAQAERDHLDELVAAYEDTIIAAGSAAGRQFGFTAAADWQPPVEGAVLTIARLAALGALLNTRLTPTWTKVLLDMAAAPLERVGIAWDVKHPLFAGQLEKAARRTGRRLGEAVQPVLRATIAAAYREGLAVPETAARISAAISEAAPWQADMLARTDLNSLANGASKSAAKLTGMGFKTWIATLDDKTRPEHADVHGETVPIDGVFVVGGEEADYPGDPNLSDAMAANCRCTVAYGSSIEEAEALLADGGGTMATMRQRQKRQARRAAKPNEALVAGAVAVHHTGVATGTWDGNAAMGRCSSAADYRSVCAWFESGADLSQRQSWKFPHHANPGGPANIAGVRNGLSRLPQADIPAGDRSGVEAHLRAHLNDFNRRQGANAVEGFDALSTEDALAALDTLLEQLAPEPHTLLAAARPIGIDGTAAIEGKLSDDSSLAPRIIMPDALSWPEMPRPFMAQTVTAEAHEGAEVAGRIDEFARKRGKGKMQNIDFAGELTTPFGIDEIAPMIEDKTMRYVSADLAASEWAIVDRKTFAVVPQEELDIDALQNGAYALGCLSAKIKAVTLVPTQAIEGASVALTASADAGGFGWERFTDDDGDEIVRCLFTADTLSVAGQALTAAADDWAPPRDWFDTPELPGKYPLSVSPEGRVYGHLATWDSCHVSFLPSCVPPPKSPSNYAYFHVSELDTEEGDTITVGKLMFSPTDGGHADRSLSAQKASQYYDRTGMAAAFLRVSDGAHGIWAAGSLNPKLSREQRDDMRRELRLNPPSGDWRPINGQYELICGLAVAVPGFPTPRATITVTASAEGLALEEAIIASSGAFEPDPQALYAAERLGLADDEALAERSMRALAARAEGMDALAALAGGEQ